MERREAEFRDGNPGARCGVPARELRIFDPQTAVAAVAKVIDAGNADVVVHGLEVRAHLIRGRRGAEFPQGLDDQLGAVPGDAGLEIGPNAQGRGTLPQTRVARPASVGSGGSMTYGGVTKSKSFGNTLPLLLHLSKGHVCPGLPTSGTVSPTFGIRAQHGRERRSGRPADDHLRIRTFDFGKLRSDAQIGHREVLLVDDVNPYCWPARRAPQRWSCPSPVPWRRSN